MNNDYESLHFFNIAGSYKSGFSPEFISTPFHILLPKVLYLQELPDTISLDDRNKLMNVDIEPRVLLYQEMIVHYADALLVRLAELYVLLKLASLSFNLYGAHFDPTIQRAPS